MRIEQTEITISMSEDNSTSLLLKAVSDTATGETVGNTSHFQSVNPIKELLPIKGQIQEIRIGSNSYKDEEISFSGNPQKDKHEH